MFQFATLCPRWAHGRCIVCSRTAARSYGCRLGKPLWIRKPKNKELFTGNLPLPARPGVVSHCPLTRPGGWPDSSTCSTRWLLT